MSVNVGVFECPAPFHVVRQPEKDGRVKYQHQGIDGSMDGGKTHFYDHQLSNKRHYRIVKYFQGWWRKSILHNNYQHIIFIEEK